MKKNQNPSKQNPSKIEKKTLIKVGVLLSVVVLLLAVDLVTKYVLEDVLSAGQTLTIIPYLFDFKLVYNIGAAWGILGGKQAFLIALSIFFLVIFIVYYIKEKNKTWLLTITFAFLIGGCLGNLYDRIFLGYVRDFIMFDFWQSFPVFNFADVFLTVGVVMFVIYIILYFVNQAKAAKIVPVLPEEVSDDENDLKADIEVNEKGAEINEKIENIDKKLKEIEQMQEKSQKSKNSEHKKSSKKQSQQTSDEGKDE